MRLPNAEHAVIDQSKSLDYLLNENHEDGRGKALFFTSVGFSREAPDELRKALLELTLSHDVTSIEPSPHGVKYAIVGRIRTPDGRTLVIKSIWMVDTGMQDPRLITAFPGRRSGT